MSRLTHQQIQVYGAMQWISFESLPPRKRNLRELEGKVSPKLCGRVPEIVEELKELGLLIYENEGGYISNIHPTTA